MATKNTENHESKIIETAKRLFIEHGYLETSMSDIAAEVGINRPTLHYYFRTKDKMFQAVFGDIISAFAPQVELSFSGDGDFMERISKVLDAYFILFKTHPNLPRFILQEAHRDMAHLISTVKSLHFDKYPRLIKKFLLDEMQKGHLKTVPISIVFLTFYSQLLFPIVGKNIVMNFFCNREEAYQRLLLEWKEQILISMKNLLCKD